MKALVKLELECDVDAVNGDKEHVWVKIPKEARGRRYMVHKSHIVGKINKKEDDSDVD